VLEVFLICNRRTHGSNEIPVKLSPRNNTNALWTSWINDTSHSEDCDFHSDIKPAGTTVTSTLMSKNQTRSWPAGIPISPGAILAEIGRGQEI